MSRPRSPRPQPAERRGPRPARTGGPARGGGLGGEQVEGHHAVRELLVVGRRRVRELFVEGRLEDAAGLEEIVGLARERRVPVRTVDREALARLARTDVPQGVVALAEPVVATELAELAEPEPTPFLVALDSVTDPHNLGAVLRSALGAGATGVLLPRHRQVHLTPSVAKAAAGAIEHLRFALVPGMASTLEWLSRRGVWAVGLEAAGSVALEEVSVFTEPLVLVLGSEGEGLSPLVRARCDLLCRIDMAGPLESLNVSASAAIACFWVARARRGGAPGASGPRSDPARR